MVGIGEVVLGGGAVAAVVDVTRSPRQNTPASCRWSQRSLLSWNGQSASVLSDPSHWITRRCTGIEVGAAGNIPELPATSRAWPLRSASQIKFCQVTYTHAHVYWSMTAHMLGLKQKNIKIKKIKNTELEKAAQGKCCPVQSIGLRA